MLRGSVGAMQTIRLAGVEVPRVGLGTNRLTEADTDFVRAAVEAGVRHIDTAHLYTDGESERTIGAAIDAGREDLVVATKGGYKDGRPEVLRAEIEQSLRSLRTERIALYYLHRVSSDTPLETSLETIKAYVDRGAIGAVGISEVGIGEIERARQVLPIAAVQNRYNLDERGHDDVIDHCEREGIVFVPYFPLRGGGAKSNQEKLAWLLGRSPVVAPIPGTRSIEHLRENLAAAA
jgi:pyridoxine 4-dehydrogenase